MSGATTGATASNVGSGIQAAGALYQSIAGFGAAKRQARQIQLAGRQQAEAELLAGETGAQSAFRNAFAALKEATIARQAAEEQVDAIRAQGANIEGTAIASAAASGIELVGSPIEVIAANALETERRAQFTLFQSRFQQEGFRAEAVEQIILAKGLRDQAKSRAFAARAGAESEAFGIRSAATRQVSQAFSAAGSLFQTAFTPGTPTATTAPRQTAPPVPAVQPSTPIQRV